MQMTWQVLTAISVLTFSISIILRRQLLFNDKSDPIAYVIVFQGLVGILTGIYAVIHGFQWPDGHYWFAILVTILLYAAAHVLSTQAFQRLEASVFSVLFATSAIWTMLIGGVLFREWITWLQLVGTILVFVSVLLLVERKELRNLKSGAVIGLATGGVFGMAITGWAYVGRHADVPSWNALSFLGPSLAVLLLRPKAVRTMRSVLNGKLLVKMLLLAAAMSISSLASLLAFSKGNVSLVAVLQQTGIIVTTVLSIIFLHERSRLWRKTVAAAVCFIAVLLIV